MGGFIRFDGVGFNGSHFDKSFQTEKDFLTELSQPWYGHLWPKIKKSERIKKLKVLYKLIKNGK